MHSVLALTDQRFDFNSRFNKEEIDVSRALCKRVECAIRLIVGL